LLLLALGAVVVGGGVAVVGRHRPGVLRSAAALALVALAAGSIAALRAERVAHNPVSALADEGAAVTLVGTVASDPHTVAGSTHSFAGEQVVVGGTPPSGAAADAVPSGAPSGPATLVNLNTATATELDTLPDVGPATAASILQWRDQHGGFTSVDELLEVDGIGEVTLGKLAPYVTV
jgi:comEA protein